MKIQLFSKLFASIPYRFRAWRILLAVMLLLVMGLWVRRGLVLWKIVDENTTRYARDKTSVSNQSSASSLAATGRLIAPMSGGITKSVLPGENALVNKDAPSLPSGGLVQSLTKIERRTGGVSSEAQTVFSVQDRAGVGLESSHDLVSAGDTLVDSGESDEPFFSEDDLRQLESSETELQASGSRLIPGAPSSGTLTAAFPPETSIRDEAEDEEENQSSSSEAAVAPPRYTGQARGYAMLYLMQPEARRTVERELETLLASGVREVFLGVLADGYFGEDFTYLAKVLRGFHRARRIVTLLLYLSNGAAQRHRSEPPSQAGFADMDPAEFRESIKHDTVVRARFVEMVQRVKPIFELNASLDPRNRNIAVVMLEDNLRADSYLAMRELARSVLGDLVEYMRNPCENCLEEGGGDSESFGDGIERHGVNQVWKLGPGDGLTLDDGVGLVFPWESGPEGSLVDDALQGAQLSMARGLKYFGLWRAARQGYTQPLLHPDLRRYERPTRAQAQYEIKILQSGLREID